MDAELRELCERLRHAYTLDPEIRGLTTEAADTLAAQAAELEGVRKDAERYRFIRENGYGLMQLNMNDTFAYACADCEDVDLQSDLDEVIRWESIAGQDGINAWVAKRRGERSLIPQVQAGIDRAQTAIDTAIANSGAGGGA